MNRILQIINHQLILPLEVCQYYKSIHTKLIILSIIFLSKWQYVQFIFSLYHRLIVLHIFYNFLSDFLFDLTFSLCNLYHYYFTHHINISYHIILLLVNPMSSQSRTLTVSERSITMSEIQQAAQQGNLLEVFGTGTAATIYPVKGIMYQNQEINVPGIYIVRL